MSCFIFAGCTPPTPRLPKSLTENFRKKRRKELFRQRPDSLQEEGTHTRKHRHGALGMVLPNYSTGSCGSLLTPQALLQVLGPGSNENRGSCSSCTSSAGLLHVSLPVPPAADLPSPYLLQAATWGRFLAKSSLPVANGNLNPF